MAEIRSTPPPLAPPPPMPSSGSSTGHAVSAPVSLNATKGSGGAGGNGNGKRTRDKSGDAALVTEETELNSLGLDRTGGSSFSEFGIGKMTLQAAFSHLRKNGEVMAPSPSELSELKKALKEHSLLISGGGGGARVEHFSAANAALEHLRQLKQEFAAAVDGSPGIDLSEFELDALDELVDAEAFDELEKHLGRGIVPFNDRGVLQPARPFGALHLPAELEPTSVADELHLQDLITDPRSGFRPEGLAAWDLERSEGISLEPVLVGRSDFNQAETGMAWAVVPLAMQDETFADLTRAAKEADALKMHLVLDATSIEPSPRLVGAIRTVSAAHPKVRVHLAIHSQA